MNLINNVMNKHHCPTQDKGMSPKRKEDNKKVWNCNICFDMCSGNSKMKTKA